MKRELCWACGTNLSNDQWACLRCVRSKTVKLDPKARDAADGRTWRYAPFIFTQPASTGQTFEEFYPADESPSK